VVFDVERPCRLLGTLEEFARLEEVPAFLAGHRTVRDALEEVAELLDRLIEEMDVLRTDGRLAKLLQPLQFEMEAVEDLHISLAIWWRIVRAFSRARATHETIECGFSGAKVRYGGTVSSFASACVAKKRGASRRS